MQYVAISGGVVTQVFGCPQNDPQPTGYAEIEEGDAAWVAYLAAKAAAAAMAAALAAYVAVLSAGLTISSTGTPSVNAAYALDQPQLSNVANLALYIVVNSKFPGGLSAVSLRKIDSTAISVPTTALMQAIATVLADYVAQCDAQLLIAQGGGTPSWPESSVTIA